MKRGETNIILPDSCYVAPEITADNPTLQQKLKDLADLAASSILYQFGSETYLLNHTITHQWINMDTLEIDQEAAAQWIKELAKKTNTAYTTRNFTFGGKTVQVTGPYGYRIDQEKELEQLLSDLQSGMQIEREPAYAQTGASRDNELGDTFVEVDLTNQHVTLYQNGEKTAEADCVTGNLAKGYDTPAGIYPLTYKQRDAVLRGPGYASPVSYWMPFNKGIGLHDATWRSSFGGNIYKSNGSHGCVNLPKAFAAKVYEAAFQGMAVICHE